MASFPVPAEVLESVLRFVPVNENFRGGEAASQVARTEQRDKAFCCVRVNTFWRLQLVYKQWREIVQRRLGEFELVISRSLGSSYHDDDAALIWNEFVTFNLNKEVDGVKGLAQLRVNYLNCYVGSAKLYCHAASHVDSNANKDYLSGTLDELSAAHFGDQPLNVDILLKIPSGQMHPATLSPTAIEIPSNISLKSLDVTNAGPYVGLVQSLLLGGQTSLKSLSVDASLLLRCLHVLPSLTLYNVTTLNLPCFTRNRFGGQQTSIPDPLGFLVRVFPNLTSLQFPTRCDPFERPSVSGHGPPMHPGLNPHRLPGWVLRPQGIVPGFVGGGPMMFRAAIIPAVDQPGMLDLRPLAQLIQLSNFDFTWPFIPSQSVLNIEHERMKSLRLHVENSNSDPVCMRSCLTWLKVGRQLETLEIAGLSHDQLVRFANNLDFMASKIDFSELKTVRLGVFTVTASAYFQLDIATVFSKFETYFAKLESITLMMAAAQVPANFSHELLANIPKQTVHMKLINIFPKQGESWKKIMVRVYSRLTAAFCISKFNGFKISVFTDICLPEWLKRFEAWLLGVITNVVRLSSVKHLQVESALGCMANTVEYYEGLLETCQHLAELSRRHAYADLALPEDCAASIRHVHVSNRVVVAEDEINSLPTSARHILVQFFLMKNVIDAPAQFSGSEQRVTFLFYNVPAY